jgi:hypothetical protein
MSEDIRETHYNAWRNNKKFVDISVTELDTKDGWVGQCKGTFGFVRYGDTHSVVVSMMRTELTKRGYEVGNLPEVMGIK